MSKRLGVVQMHYTDLFPEIHNNNAVSKLLESDVVDHVVIVSADIEQNDCLSDIASEWGCDIRFGAVENVTARIDQVATEYGADLLLRVLPQWYFIDIDLVDSMFRLLESSGGDYVSLPRDFDIRFGGDIFSRRFIEILNRELDSADHKRKQLQFNPWGYVEANGHPSLKIVDLNTVPEYSNSDFELFRERYNAIWPEQWDKADTPQAPYRLADRFMGENSTVLDIACGHGAGSKYLVDQGGNQVVGVDVSEEIIDHCKQKYSGVENLVFRHGDALDIEFAVDSFDLVVTIHTMEHVIDDEQFLINLQRWLKPGGVVILEVPLLMRLPFKNSDQPYGDAHIREYYPKPLLNLFERYFEVVEVYGVSRGFYVEREKARNAMLLIGGQFQ